MRPIKEAEMGKRRALVWVLVVLVGAIALPAFAQAEGDISISIAKHARLTSGGAVVITLRIACEPLPGTEDFQEALAGARQARTGAEAEGGIDGTVVCDGVERTHTARLVPFTEEVFKRGPADASAMLLVCNVDGDDQVCAHRNTHRRIVIRGPVVP
jgi:hypothetical protein